ncbi:alpha-amylase family glycosyl hydrolase [Flavobacterium difficile]|uniref:T9SS type A sorting domain-containing protein n=1 Tax=Flavobacterium difficile TaxID=2709659 RepID=A0ABX0I9V7_9FLAO|nr:alpha-amylase family glycosyl hydrolase [Flavobacterium difficile]NHM02945.1 T9SS type A sorting domain-containing protein [Flavobacterium difficile]
MKKITQIGMLFLTSFLFAQQQTVTSSIAPTVFEDNQSITITINGSSVNEAAWGVTGNALYIWAWSFDNNDANIADCPTNGTWTNSSETNRFTYNSGPDTYTMTLTPNAFYNRFTGIGRIGFLVKAKDGTGDKKSQDILSEVGAFNFNLVSPAQNSNIVQNSGGNVSISANNTNGTASYILKANGVTLPAASQTTTTYAFTVTNITTNTQFELSATQGATTLTKRFNVIVNPTTVLQALPAGLEIGINYNTSDATKATLVIEAPGKDFIYVAGSFNNWQPNSTYAMKKNTTGTKFWYELTGLTPGQIYTYQYWVVDQTPTTNSPALVKTADPCSTLVLSPFDDGGIPAASYPGMPAYPVGQEREVTVLQTGQTPYNWQVTNFTKPNKDKLVVYEVLVRDFDANRNYQDLINKIDYFKNLGINAIQLMPVMEYEGNESWGYNTSFHMALDKYYGTSNKLKEFVDLCHQNGIAVILDIAFNHAFGRNPMVRMWMNDTSGGVQDGWGPPNTDNPYFNTTARHSYSVGEDFNHTSALTREYVNKTIKHWITEFKIDGFRWDLTKGFTQNCTGTNETCTNGYQADRVDVLRLYADNSWAVDPNHYVIFEHLGSDFEEQQWANYRLGEGKGIMMWGEMFTQYKELAMGYSNTTGNISRMSHLSRGFSGKRLLGYAESHDKDRLMYEAKTFGNNTGTNPVLNNEANALKRMSALGAVSILIPGPKMIWHFQELAMDDSIYSCENGVVNSETDATPGDCKLATKLQPQWAENWLTTTPRSTVYADYSKFIKLKKEETVFNGEFAISPESNDNLKQRIYIFDNSLLPTQLKNVVILANLYTSSQNITADFPYAGNWYNLMDNSITTVSATNMQITIPAGEFRIFGNQPSAVLSNESFNSLSQLELYPNPTSNAFMLSVDAKKVEIYSITGQLIKTENNSVANKEISISDLSKGIYIVKITNADNVSVSKKLIKE